MLQPASPGQGGLIFDTAAAAGSPQCLQFVPGRRVHDHNPCWCSQVVPLAVPGGRYRVSANLSGPAKASVMVQWTKAGNWYGGSWPAQGYAPGSNSGGGGVWPWRTLAQEFVVPLDVDKGTVYVSVYNGYSSPASSAAAWASVELVAVSDPPLRSIVLAPSYRGRVTKTAPSKVAVRVWANLPGNIPLLRARLRRPAADGGAVLAEVQVERPKTSGTRHVDLVFPQPPQPLLATPGLYTLEVQCLDPHGAGGTGSNTTVVLAEASHTLTRVPDDAPEPPAWIDGEQRLVVDGAPFFPLGLYVIMKKER